MKIDQFEDQGLAHFSYAILSESARAIVLIDPARDPQPYYEYAKAHDARIVSVIETHPHADFVSSHLEIVQTTGAIIRVSKLLGADYPHQAFDEGDAFAVGKLTFRALNTPGHSPDSISIVLSRGRAPVRGAPAPIPGGLNCSCSRLLAHPRYLLISLVAMFDSLKSSAPAVQNLTPAQFAEGLRQPGAVLLDVRRPDEFTTGHLPGAVNVEVTSPDFAERIAQLDHTRPTYVYCRSGARSASAAGQLATAGFAQVANLLGGVLGWPEPLITS